MKPTFKAILILCILPHPAWSCELEELIFLKADNRVTYEFKQEKTISALSRPLVSSGIIALTGSQELIWQTLTPLKSTMVISGDVIKQYDREDTLINEINNPMAVNFSNILLTVLSGNMQYLKDSFKLSLSCTGPAWQLNLVPDSDEYKKILTSLTLSGTQSLDEVSFEESRGDLTNIRLFNHSNKKIENLEFYVGD